ANAAANHGTLGAAWTGTYAGAGVQLGNALVAKGTEGPRPADQPGFEAGNTAVGMTNGWVTAPPLVLGSQVTTIAWMRRQEISTTGDLSWPAWLGGGGLHLNNGSVNIPDAELRYHWNGDKWGWPSGLFVPPDVWTFIALVVEPDQATMYMSDGTTLLSSVNTTSHTPMVVNSPPGFGGNQPGRADRTFLGQLDETAVYDRALTPEEITAIFESAFSDAPAAPGEITLSKTGDDYFLNWTSGVLQAAPAVTGPFSDVTGAASPYRMEPAGTQSYYRLRGGN
ncbi:MAG TPA: LamG domain-containing protein, partial [Verrucomicrobiota bacterium]|nr:LamG domain-containing protein [Verrucomicrobiota bacterium]